MKHCGGNEQAFAWIVKYTARIEKITCEIKTNKQIPCLALSLLSLASSLVDLMMVLGL
jgi:hypothetical protein